LKAEKLEMNGDNLMKVVPIGVLYKDNYTKGQLHVPEKKLHGLLITFLFLFRYPYLQNKKTALIHVEYNPDISGLECLSGQTSTGSEYCSPKG
jgi:hypothetical protein